MSVESDAREVMRALVGMFASGDTTQADNVVSVDYLDHQGIGVGPMRGVEGFRQVVAAARHDYTLLDVVVLDQISEGDKSVARIAWRGTRSSGEVDARETIDIVRVIAGRAAEHWGARV